MLTQPVFERTYFDDLKNKLLGELKPKEHLFITLSAESSQFIRLNAAKVRQIGTVDDAMLELTMVYEAKPDELRKSSHTITLTGISYTDREEARRALQLLREETPELPVDPYAELPRNLDSSETEASGNLLPIADAAETLVQPLRGIDLAGIYSSGPIVRATANSAGQTHWFSTQTFSLDYSLYTPSQRALKGTFGGKDWNGEKYRAEILEAAQRLSALERKPKSVPRGTHRAYLGPAAVSDLIAMFSWGVVGEAALRQGDSPLRHLRSGTQKLSPLFSLSEDFRGGEVPRFNDEGELAPEYLPLIAGGKLENTLVCARTAKEYGVPSNAADESETLRSPSLAAGTLADSAILERLDTGLYLSNLHYLNWSDQPNGRITGMTRYACFWVENGRITAPIENMRFDDTIFSLFGDSLEALTLSRSYVPEVSTYFLRQLGGIWVPGMLVSEMKFTI